MKKGKNYAGGYGNTRNKRYLGTRNSMEPIISSKFPNGLMIGNERTVKNESEESLTMLASNRNSQKTFGSKPHVPPDLITPNYNISSLLAPNIPPVHGMSVNIAE